MEELGSLAALRVVFAGQAGASAPQAGAPAPQAAPRTSAGAKPAPQQAPPPQAPQQQAASKQAAPKQAPVAAGGGPAPAAPAPGADEHADVAPTRPLYLEDTYSFECAAEVLKVSSNTVVLSQTVFHPQGGGQPCDFGTITCGACVFNVDAVRATARSGGRVAHSGTWGGAMACVGDAAEVCIDADRRRLCARLHSAGHALDVAMARAGQTLPPAKGYHFPDGGAYVEYDGTVSAADLPQLVEALNAHLAQLIGEDLQTVRRVDAKTGDRIIQVAGADCPCGGTHVSSTAELVQVTVTRCKNKAKKLRVSYTMP
ncbi:hypothetical protein M885DRAFT_616898 [Pelagophyceae sp. CCMP2097]|nr:hypothetical protein M885DRAFT_616898 [Pelagophyceae sp. CCMP2097]